MPRRIEQLLAWLPGTAVVLAGVAAVRLLAPLLAGRPQAIVAVAGYLLVPVGLLILARQINRRAAIRAAAASGPRA